MSLTIIEVIQLVAKGYIGALKVLGTDTVIEVFEDSLGNPMYGNIEAPEVPMDQPTFYRAYQHRMFEQTDDVLPEPEPEPEPDSESDGKDEDDADEEGIVEWANNPDTSDSALSDYLVDVAGEAKRNWSRSTMVEKIQGYVTTGSAD